MKCSLPARIRLVHSCTANWSGRLLIALAPIFYSSSRRKGAAGRCRGSEQQAAGNSLSARLTNCVKALQQSANRFCCTSVPCSGALVASASSSSDGQQQQEQEQRAADGAASPETGQAKPFHLRTATRLLNMIMRSIAGSQQQQQQIAVWGNCKKEKGVREQGAGRRRQGERQRTITGSEAAPSVVTLAGNA